MKMLVMSIVTARLVAASAPNAGWRHQQSRWSCQHPAAQDGLVTTYQWWPVRHPESHLGPWQ